MDNINYNFLIIFFIFNLLIFVFYKKILSFINLYDCPDKRKIHLIKTNCSGGIFVATNAILVLVIYLCGFYDFGLDYFFTQKKQLYSFILTSIFFLILGILDDKYNISANKKFFWSTIIIFFNFILDPALVITKIIFNEKIVIELNQTSLIFTILCILVFINFYNMFDGINLQAILYALFILVSLFVKNIFTIFFIIIIIALLPVLILNYKKKIFLGNNGVFFLGYLLSYFLIKSYNLTNISVNEIVIITFVPLIDMIRLIILRTINNKNIFDGDLNHFHHILIKKFSFFSATIFIQFMVIIPLILFYYFNIKYFSLVCIFLIYLILLSKFNNNGT